MKKITTIMYFGIIAFFLLGLFFCGYYAPNTFGLYSGTNGIWESTELIFYWLCSVPCFILLCLAVKITYLVKKGEFFSLTTVKLLSIGGYLLAADSITFIVVNIVFAILRKSLNTEVLMTLFSLVGLAIGVSMILISKAVEQSKQYKDSGEGVI